MRKTILSILFIIILWIFITIIFNPPSYLFPSIVDVYKAFESSYSEYIINSLYTITEIFIGFFIANIIGLFLAIFALYNKLLEKFLTTLAVIIKTIPIIAIAPLLVLWFGHGMYSKYAAVSLTCFSPILINILSSAKLVMAQYKNLSTIYNINKFQEIKYIILPGIVPSLVSSLKISSSLAVVGALVSEFICANKGLGYLIVSNYNSMNIPGVFICIVFSSFMGIIIFELCNLLELKKFEHYEKV